MKIIEDNASFEQAVQHINNGGVSAYSYWRTDEFIDSFNGMIMKNTGDKYHPTIQEVMSKDWILLNK